MRIGSKSCFITAAVAAAALSRFGAGMFSVITTLGGRARLTAVVVASGLSSVGGGWTGDAAGTGSAGVGSVVVGSTGSGVGRGAAGELCGLGSLVIAGG